MRVSVDGSVHEAGLETPDAEVMATLHAADGQALAILFRRYARLVYRVAVNILRDTGEAEDVTQEVFLEVYRKAHLYDPSRGSVRGWVLQYAYHRSLRRKGALSRRAAYRGEPLDRADAALDAPLPRLTPAECRWVLRAGLARLPPRQRETLELACFEDLSLREIAMRLGVSLGCARHYYYRGLARLRAWARDAFEDSSPRGLRPHAVALQHPIQLVPRHAELGGRAGPVRVVPFERRQHLANGREHRVPCAAPRTGTRA